MFTIPKFHLAFNPIFLWYNKHILFHNKPIYRTSFSDKNVNFINNLLGCLGNFKSWNVLTTGFKLGDSLYFSWMQLINAIPRSSRVEVFCKQSVLRNFASFIGKHLCQSLFFNKVAARRPTTLLKKRLWHRCFPVNFVKFLRTPFFIEHLWWLLLNTFELEKYH